LYENLNAPHSIAGEIMNIFFHCDLMCRVLDSVIYLAEQRITWEFDPGRYNLHKC